MVTTKTYRVAGHYFSVEAEEKLLEKMQQYAPFEVADGASGTSGAGQQGDDEKSGETVFSLQVMTEIPFPEDADMTVETSQDDDGSQIVAGRCGGQSYFEFQLWGDRSAQMLVGDDYRQARVWLYRHKLFGINNALMVMYALSTANKGTALFHSAVVGYEGHGYMFLGKSGTGKSTHASLWCKYISGTELINDDNPVVRVFTDHATVYGSPWSGKTPCYRNVSLPLGGIVQLSQAPYNAIRRLHAIEAYAALVPSISGKRWERSVADGLHQTESQLAGQIPVWHLECLPDEEAALLCCKTVSEL